MDPGSICDVERRILRDHGQIRARLRGLKKSADEADVPWVSHVLRILLLRFTTLFEAHLALEERELGPHLRALGARGNVREEAFLFEHRKQRRQLEELRALAESPPSAETICLVDAVADLVESLLDDMRDEERWIAELAQLDEQGHAQVTA
jgi:hypothetical protein